MLEKLLNLAIQIQQIPAPTFQETARAQFILEKFTQEGLADPQTDSTGNVLARLPGRGSAPPLILSAHLDTVFPAETDLTPQRTEGRLNAPGIGDNSLGVAALLGLRWMLRERNAHLPGDLWFIANIAEEGLGDLKGMKAICDRFEDTPLAYLVLEGMALGHIYHRAIGVRRYKISVQTAGGHSWADYGQPSAIHQLAHLIEQLVNMPIQSNPRTTFNVGRVQGGTSVNTIAAEAWLELDLRSESAYALGQIAARVAHLVQQASRPGVHFDIRLIGHRPVGEIAPSHPLILLAKNSLAAQGIEPRLTLGSTDANIPLSRGYPALVMGITRGGGAHTLNEYIETAPIVSGMEQLFAFVTRAWNNEKR